MRSFHWENLLVSRAIENQSFVVGVYRVGEDGIGLDVDPLPVNHHTIGYSMGAPNELDLDEECLLVFLDLFGLLEI